MRIRRFSNQIIIIVLGVVLLSNCKKEITKVDSYPSFGRAYPMNGNQNIAGAIKTLDGGYLIWGNTNAGAQAKRDCFLMRLDSNYSQLWYKTFGGPGDDYFESATFDGQGNILAAGTSTSFGVSLDTNSISPGPCIYAVYVNSNGELLWQKTYSGNPGAKHYSEGFSKVLLLPNQNFALIGSSNNYPEHIGPYSVIMPHAFIQCINNQGDTLWQSHYSFIDSILALPGFPYVFYKPGNAMISPDGNIEMLVVMQDSGKKDFLMSLIKVAPNSTSGYNNYISRIPIEGDYRGVFNAGIYGAALYKSLFFPMQLVNESSENYLIATQSEMILCNPGGTVLKRVVISETSVINDLLFSNGSAWFATNHNLIKTDLNGTIIWSNTAYDKLKIDNVKGIFMQKDNSISVFCSYTNAVGEKDIALLRLDENGELILK